MAEVDSNQALLHLVSGRYPLFEQYVKETAEMEWPPSRVRFISGSLQTRLTQFGLAGPISLTDAEGFIALIKRLQKTGESQVDFCIRIGTLASVVKGRQA